MANVWGSHCRWRSNSVYLGQISCHCIQKFKLFYLPWNIVSIKLHSVALFVENMGFSSHNNNNPFCICFRVHQMFNTANYSYIIPFHRLTSYIIGIFFGFALRHYDKHYRIKSSYLRLGWTITFSFLSYILTKASEMNYPGYVYNNKEAAIYAALAPIAWSLLVGWMIFVSQMGCGG